MLKLKYEYNKNTQIVKTDKQIDMCSQQTYMNTSINLHYIVVCCNCSSLSAHINEMENQEIEIKQDILFERIYIVHLIYVFVLWQLYWLSFMYIVMLIRI